MPGAILASGGYALGTALDDALLQLSRGPRVLFVPTASADGPERIVDFYDSFARRAEPSHLLFHPWPPADLRRVALETDAIYVAGGNTVNMLAIWRAHGFDHVLREAWESGVTLAGWSAGMICWFEAGVTDSFGPELGGLRDGLGLLRGSACPHYDSEERRRPLYRELVATGFPPGYAADDGVGLVFEGAELREAVSAGAGGRAYRVTAEGEESIEPRVL